MLFQVFADGLDLTAAKRGRTDRMPKTAPKKQTTP